MENSTHRQIPEWSRPWLVLATGAVAVITALPIHAATNVVATVAGSPISVERVKSTMARNGYNVFQVESAQKALDELVNNEVIAAAARQQGFEQHPEVAERIKLILLESYITEKVDRPLQGFSPSDEELKAYYEAHKSEFSQPAFTRGQVLTVFITDGKDGEAANRVGAAMASIKSGKTFEDAIAHFSDDPNERMSRGASTWFSAGKSNRRYPDEVVKALAGTKVGDVAGPIKTARAYYLAKPTEQRPEAVRGFAESKPAIQRAVLLAKRQVMLDKLCAELRKDFPIKVDDAQLKSAVESSTPNAGPPSGPVDLK